MTRSSWDYHYGYSRSAESRAADDRGQDYLTFQEDGGSIIFVLCDGISMSYYGDFAARFLGNCLLDWLNSLPEGIQNEESLQQQLDQLLRERAVRATERLKYHQIPPHIRGIHREVLASKKELGSSAIYGCGRIDFPGERYPEGRIVLAWQGDIRLRLWAEQKECTAKLGDRFHTSHQWNSKSGPVGGMPHVHCESLCGEGDRGAVLLYSDGLKGIDSWNVIAGSQLSQAMTNEARNPSSDDMSVFYVRWNFTLFKEVHHDRIST